MRPGTALVGLLAAATLAFAPAAPLGTAVPATVGGAIDAGETSAVAGNSIVVLTDGVADPLAVAGELLAPLGLQPYHVYRHALVGFAVAAPAELLAPLAADPRVAYVEADREVVTAAQTLPRGVDRVDAEIAAGIGNGSSVNVDIAILDTGIANHGDLNVVERRDCTDRSIEASVEYVEYLLYGTCKSGGSDANGHGTSVAGIAAARDNTSDVVGVAPGARLHAIKVIQSADGGSLTDLVAGVDHVAAEADTIEVANISLVAEGSSDALSEAIAGAVEAGVVVVVAAGNDAKNASGYTPANVAQAITVSAITDLDGRPRKLRSGSCFGSDDTFATYSNFGSVVDIAAPGSCIQTTAREGGVTTVSGTSMAAPHVAGAAALRIVQTGRGAAANRASVILGDLLSTAASEGTTCGYTGSPSNERLLDLRKGC